MSEVLSSCPQCGGRCEPPTPAPTSAAPTAVPTTTAPTTAVPTTAVPTAVPTVAPTLDLKTCTPPSDTFANYGMPLVGLYSHSG